MPDKYLKTCALPGCTNKFLSGTVRKYCLHCTPEVRKRAGVYKRKIYRAIPIAKEVRMEFTFKEIGQALDPPVSKQRASQIFYSGIAKLERVVGRESLQEYLKNR